MRNNNLLYVSVLFPSNQAIPIESSNHTLVPHSNVIYIMETILDNQKCENVSCRGHKVNKLNYNLLVYAASIVYKLQAIEVYQH